MTQIKILLVLGFISLISAMKKDEIEPDTPIDNTLTPDFM